MEKTPNCAGLTYLFYENSTTGEYEDIDRIVGLCKTCSLSDECLDKAVSFKSEKGFWARTDVSQRKEIRNFIENEDIPYVDLAAELLSASDTAREYYLDESAMFVI